MRNACFDVSPLSGAGGAEISGIDLARDLDAATVSQIRTVLNEHCVVFLRDQDIDVERHKAFARCFGEIFVHPLLRGMGKDSEVVMVRREPGDTSYFGESWHADTTMCAEPPMGTILYGIDVPPYGGDTLFANQYLAFESLSGGMKKMLVGLRAVHCHSGRANPQAGNEPPTVHPVVRTNPETGRKMLFVNEYHTSAFEGMTEAESRPLLDFLFEHGNRPEFTFRFRWQKGSIAFWDNRSTKHIALGDTGLFCRLMRRIQICGDRPV
ncbi:MAG: TauD/TfdA family dioxygenase [Reyranella sp.]|nr:TauD/TfdA family dioxygenase [Reyranella sp.]